MGTVRGAMWSGPEETRRSDGHVDRNHVGIRCYPVTDRRFNADVQAVVDACSDGELTADSLTHQLAAAYPAIKVVPQESLAALGSSAVFYVYRDGHP